MSELCYLRSKVKELETELSVCKNKCSSFEEKIELYRVENVRLTKVLQKMYSNISKLGTNSEEKKCNCDSPEPVSNKSMSSGSICLNCAGA